MIEEHRPWGYYVVLSNLPDHKVKRLQVNPGKRLSLQRHKERSEHWFFIRGEALVTFNHEQFLLKVGDSIDIPKGTIHRIENLGTSVVQLIEVQMGEYFGEDDIERLEDDFGRITE